MSKTKKLWIDLKQQGAKVYKVGGFVRDKLLGIESKDQDILICALPIDKIITILQQYGRVEVVGNSFQILKFISQGITYDITFPRLSPRVSTTISFPEGFDPFLPLEEDLANRDFTINAIAEDLMTGTIIDPLGGAKDLKERRIKMTSPAVFNDDPLRILRGAQLAARLEFTIEHFTLKLMGQKVQLLKEIPPERIMEELVKVLTKSKRPSIYFNLLKEIDALTLVHPAIADCIDITQNRYHAHDVYKHTMNLIDLLPVNLELRLAGLYHDAGKKESKTEGEDGQIHFYGHEKKSVEILRKELSELCFSNAIIGSATNLVLHHLYPTPESEKAARRFTARVGPDLALPLLTLKQADNIAKGKEFDLKEIEKATELVRKVLEQNTTVTVKQLAITGKDILDLDIPQGPLIGKILSKLLELVIDDPALNTRPALLKIAKELNSL